MFTKRRIFGKERRNVFLDSYDELKKTRTLVITALLIALGIILGQWSVQITETMKIGISFIATQMTALLFGPVVGGIMGVMVLLVLKRSKMLDRFLAEMER